MKSWRRSDTQTIPNPHLQLFRVLNLHYSTYFSLGSNLDYLLYFLIFTIFRYFCLIVFTSSGANNSEIIFQRDPWGASPANSLQMPIQTSSPFDLWNWGIAGETFVCRENSWKSTSFGHSEFHSEFRSKRTLIKLFEALSEIWIW